MKMRNKEEERKLFDEVLPSIFKFGFYFEEGREVEFIEYCVPHWPKSLKNAGVQRLRGELASEDFEAMINEYFDLPPIT